MSAHFQLVTTKGWWHDAGRSLDFAGLATNGFMQSEPARYPFTNRDIVKRMFLTLPSYFSDITLKSLDDQNQFVGSTSGTIQSMTKVEGGVERTVLHTGSPSGFVETYVFDFFYKAAGAFYQALWHLNELDRDNHVLTAGAPNLDNIINENSRLVRLDNELHHDFRRRYLNFVFGHNFTLDGIDKMVYYTLGAFEPVDINEKSYVGNFYNGYSFWDDNYLNNFYSMTIQPYSVFIVLSQRPTVNKLEELAKLLDDIKPCGLKYYILWLRENF